MTFAERLHEPTKAVFVSMLVALAAASAYSLVGWLGFFETFWLVFGWYVALDLGLKQKCGGGVAGYAAVFVVGPAVLFVATAIARAIAA